MAGNTLLKKKIKNIALKDIRIWPPYDKKTNRENLEDILVEI